MHYIRFKYISRTSKYCLVLVRIIHLPLFFNLKKKRIPEYIHVLWAYPYRTRYDHTVCNVKNFQKEKNEKLSVYLYASDTLLAAPLLHKHRVFSCASNAACTRAYDIRENIAHKFRYNLTENKIKIHKYPCNLLLLSLFHFFCFLPTR